MTQAPRRASIYDLASNLSKGLTAQAQSGQPPSIGGGLAAGFNSFSDYANAIDKGNEDMLASIRTKAATLAIQDEQEGKKLYNSLLAQYVLKDPSKLGDVEFFVNYGVDGKTDDKLIEKVFATLASFQAFNSLEKIQIRSFISHSY